jgi:hypothetical protein
VPFNRSVEVVGLAGVFAALRDEHDVAERHLRCAFEAEPGQPGWAWYLAAVLRDERRPVEALRVLAEALRHSRGDDDLCDLKRQLLATFRAA